MSRPIFLAPPQHELPKNISRVFYKLAEFIDENHPDLSQEAKEVLFCIAYAKYCRDKKEFVNGQIDRKLAKPGDPSIQQSHPQFCDDGRFSRYCEEAEELIVITQKNAASDVIAQISGAVGTSVGEKIAESMSYVDAKISSIVDRAIETKESIHEVKGYIADQHNVSLKKFVKESLIHAVALLVAGASLLILAKIFMWSGPFIWEQGKKTFGPIVDFLGLRL